MSEKVIAVGVDTGFASAYRVQAVPMLVVTAAALDPLASPWDVPSAW